MALTLTSRTRRGRVWYPPLRSAAASVQPRFSAAAIDIGPTPTSAKTRISTAIGLAAPAPNGIPMHIQPRLEPAITGSLVSRQSVVIESR